MKDQDGYIQYILLAITLLVFLSFILHQVSRHAFVGKVSSLVGSIAVPSDITLLDTQCRKGDPVDQGAGYCTFSYLTNLSGPAAIAAFSEALKSAGYSLDTTTSTPLNFSGSSGKLTGHVGYYKGQPAPVRLQVSLTP
jgi:hypothetical protein